MPVAELIAPAHGGQQKLPFVRPTSHTLIPSRQSHTTKLPFCVVAHYCETLRQGDVVKEENLLPLVGISYLSYSETRI